MACFMGLLSFVASRSEVFRVSPRLKKSLSNAAARANIQSASVTSSPLTDAGLTGEGEVVQVRGERVTHARCCAHVCRLCMVITYTVTEC